MLVSPSSRVHGIGASKVLKLVVDLDEVGVGPILVLPMAWMSASITTVLLLGARQLLTNWFGLALKHWMCH